MNCGFKEEWKIFYFIVFVFRIQILNTGTKYNSIIYKNVRNNSFLLLDNNKKVL